MSDEIRSTQTQAGHLGTGQQGTTGTGMNAQSQTGLDTGRSAEYRDGLTVQDETKAAGSSGIDTAAGDFNDTATGAHASGGGSTGWSEQPAQRADGSRTDDYHGDEKPKTHGRDLGDNSDGAGRDRTDAVTADETGTLISADKVQGTAVYDAGGERLGTIDSLMLNKRAGKVAYAVMSFGGFLGIGERYHPLPWDCLTYDVDKGGYNIGHTADTLRKGPNYSRDDIDAFDRDDRRAGEVDDYYGRGGLLDGGMTRAGGVPIV